MGRNSGELDLTCFERWVKCCSYRFLSSADLPGSPRSLPFVRIFRLDHSRTPYTGAHRHPLHRSSPTRLGEGQDTTVSQCLELTVWYGPGRHRV
jgi:hypothetical protein